MIMPLIPNGTALFLAGVISAWAAVSAPAAFQKSEYSGFYSGHGANKSGWVESIAVKSPEPGSAVKGNVVVEFEAKGMTRARALCWKQPTADHPDPRGHDTQVCPDMTLDAQGHGSFVFPADQYPNGPATVRILAANAANTRRDLDELQLYNTGGVVWNQGIPKTDPPAARGMTLVFSDDFNGALSISGDGKTTRYCAHTPWNGDFSGWPFRDAAGPLNPFSIVGTFLRIHASKTAFGESSTGLISSVGTDGGGFSVQAPCYFECRFTALAASGTWPAFWLSTNKAYPQGTPSDELDVMEGYGGKGDGNPNDPGYSVTTHFWDQKTANGKPATGAGKQVGMTSLGGRSFWSTTFHTYGVKVTTTETIYYLDDLEVFRHPSGKISATEPLFFLIDYAIGGNSGWKIDLEREHNVADMYVDFVRVYEGGGD
jgi:hypothetical protein